MKPRVFIGSSVEGRDIAEAIQAGLEHDVDATVWHQGVFEPGTTFIDALVKQVRDSDFGIFVLRPDDVTQMREKQQGTPRDNVVFEVGLFIGALGRDRVFGVAPRMDSKTNIPLHLPTDLLGIEHAWYTPPKEAAPNWRAVVGTACRDIKNAMRGRGILKRHSIAHERARFAQFFGNTSSASKLSMKAVFTTACHPGLRPNGTQDLPGSSADPWSADACHDFYFPRPPPKALAARAMPKGIRHVTPFEDVGAALVINKEFSKHGATLDWSLDQDYSNTNAPLPSQGLIAVGLGFNNVTARLSESCPGLFGISYDTMPDGRVSDDFYLGDPDHKIEHDRPNAIDDYALVARIIGARGTPHFVAAGRTAPGTVAACHYLANHWSTMLDMYDAGIEKKQTARDNLALILRFRVADSDSGAIEGIPLFRQSNSVWGT